MIQIDSKKIKEIMFSLGADLCGIADAGRFAPEQRGERIQEEEFRETVSLPDSF